MLNEFIRDSKFENFGNEQTDIDTDKFLRYETNSNQKDSLISQPNFPLQP